ncbi:acetate/propionate family kinase [Tardiphaga sp. 709]|uniref:acetate/propionate family kinase n=1 Tax=Tardiphaga sp. 709 TaxID=3076039 RepID=UPI0028E281D5|nr:acetate/propionate family kinase [Tardiphaga sp. 709]WNV11906.1 acetate/propionate family kinase [Tardiphaga sp. 709]
MPDAVLVVNSGSSSIKLALFEIASDREPRLLCRGSLDEHDAEPRLTIKVTDGAVLYDQHRKVADGHGEELLLDALNWVDGYLASDDLIAVGHRVVHGGLAFAAPVRLTGSIVNKLAKLTPMAPVHQPRCLSPIRAIMTERPELPQIACFDTAFHHSLPASATRFAIPRQLHDTGIRRYGFHGLSFEFIAGRLQELSPSAAEKRCVIAHLGSGASLCAMRGGASIDTTMGFTPLDGLVMATRCGAIDPGVLLYLQQELGMSATDLENLLYRESGLLGVSGLSGDMRALLASKDPHASEAIDLFVTSIARESAMMVNSLHGLDCLIFTGGVGEHAQEIRRRVCERMSWLGLTLDTDANDAGSACISTWDSSVEIRIIPTNEELVIARYCVRNLADSISDPA